MRILQFIYFIYLIILSACSSNEEVCNSKIDYFKICSGNNVEIPLKDFPFELKEILESSYGTDSEIVGFSSSFCDNTDTLNYVQIDSINKTILIYDQCNSQLGTMSLLAREHEYQSRIQELFEFQIENIDFIWEIQYLNNTKEYLTGIIVSDLSACNNAFCFYKIDSEFSSACLACR